MSAAAPPPSTPAARSSTRLTQWSLAALLGGFAFGLAGHFSRLSGFEQAGSVAQTVGELWIAALQMVTLPLALLLTLAAIAGARLRSVGALGLRTVLFYLVALALLGLITLLVAPLLLSPYSVDPATVSAMNAHVAVPDAVTQARPVSAAAWLSSLVPRNIFAAAVRGEMFPLLLFVILLGLAVTQLPEEPRLLLGRGFHALADAMLVLVRWLLVVTPLGVFALSYVMVLRLGATLAGMLGVYLLLISAATLFVVLLLYPLTAALGRTTLAAFARAVLPGQLVAVTTRSSIAALPAQVEAGRRFLGLPPVATDFLLPLNVALFRVGEVVTNPVKLILLAHVYGIALQPGAVAAFLATVIVFSFSSTGTPNSGGGSGFRMVPVFVAAGIPLEGVLILEAVETIPDIFETLANVTGQQSAARILAPRQ